MQPVQIGVLGLGTAARACAPAFARHPGLKIVAAADSSEQTRDAFSRDYGVPAFADLASMLRQPGLDAVYVATPTELHAQHALEALRAGKHVIVEKPMASTLDDAKAMASAAAEAGRVLLVGHSHSFDPPIQKMREVIGSGRLGKVRMINTWCFSDWVYRPRRPQELDPRLGGSVLFRQGSHQFDIIRWIGGGAVRSVRAQVFDLDPQRRTIGAHLVMLTFQDGAAATAVYNGYGGVPSSLLCGGIGEWGFPEDTTWKPSRSRAVADEGEAKRKRAAKGDKSGAPYQPHFGLTIVSCEGGDIRQSPTGLIVYGPDECTEIDIPRDASPHFSVASEFYEAVSGAAPARHDGRWGLANLEICHAALESAQRGQEVLLHEQVALP